MSEKYLIKCSDCGDVIEVVSPANLNCQKCGCGMHVFPRTMLFKCLAGHIHIGDKSNPFCEECPNADRSMYRTFSPSTQIGDKGNKFPVEDKVHKSKPKKASAKKPAIKRRPKKKK